MRGRGLRVVGWMGMGSSAVARKADVPLPHASLIPRLNVESDK